jgi:PAS domain S-box-containing protein
MMGITAYLAVHEYWLWRGSRGEPFHGWVALWSAVVFEFVAGRFLQRIAVEESHAAFGLRLQLAGGAAIAVLSVVMVRATNGASLRATWLRGFVVCGVVLAAVCVATPWFVTDHGAWGVDLLGARYISPVVHPAALGFAPLFAISTGACVRELARSRGTGGRRRRALRPLVVACGLAAANDLLLLMGLIRSTHLFEYVFVGLTITVSFVVMLRVDDVRAQLESAVVERTAALREHQNQLEAALTAVRLTEARFRNLSAAALDGVLVHEGGTIIDVNEAMARLIGTHASALVGRPIDSLVTAGTRSATIAVLEGDTATPVEAAIVAVDGDEHPVELMARRHHDGQREVGVVAVRGIAERKRMQAQLLLNDRLASLGTLAAGAAHEINNPLAYVTVNVELVRERLQRPEPIAVTEREGLVAALERAREGCERIRAIVANLKALARGDALATRPVDLADVLDGALRMVGNELRHRARLVRSLADVPLVLGDEGRLGQVFVNLLVNAIASIPDCDVAAHEIEVSLAMATDGHHVVACVRDTGAGIGPEVIDRVFDPFFTTRAQGHGMGLGLSICHSIVRASGGEISVTSELGRGSRFCVTLPCAPARIDVAEATSELAAPLPFRRARILVADDEGDVADSIARALAAHDVRIASGGRQAVALASTGDYDLVLCDLMMPDLPGMGVYDELHAIDPDLASRLVFVTGGAFSPAAREFLARIGNARLEKPVAIAALRSFVQQWLSDRSSAPLRAG